MEKNELRVVIKYLNLKGLTTTEIKKDLDSTLGGNAPSISTVNKWQSEFRRGGTSTNDAPRSGRPKDATSQENIKKLKKIVISGRKFKTREIARAVGISTGSVSRILDGDPALKLLLNANKSAPNTRAKRKKSANPKAVKIGSKHFDESNIVYLPAYQP